VKWKVTPASDERRGFSVEGAEFSTQKYCFTLEPLVVQRNIGQRKAWRCKALIRRPAAGRTRACCTRDVKTI